MCHLSLKASPPLSDLMPQIKQTRAQWKSIIQMEKDKQITKRMTCHHQSTPNTSIHDKNHAPNQVKLVDKHYLQHKYYTKSNLEKTHRIRSQFQLNKDQERSFNIITQHTLLPNSDQLKLYIGGMGGTGKTRVINAISQFFTEKGQASRFVVMAPTGTAAALLSGSTYHSLLGINDWKKNSSDKKLAETRNQMLKADYIFLDEVSMLSCRDLYRISAQLARIYNCSDLPFGGANMIFAGDFGQLPPPIGNEKVAAL